MSEPREFGIVGFRPPGEKLNIGGELGRQLQLPGVAERLRLSSLPKWVMRTSGFMGPDGRTPLGYDPFTADEPWPDVTFVCLPSNQGELATQIMLTALGHRDTNIAITAEKDALANPNYYRQLQEASDGFRRLGKTATLGGGTHLADVARQWCRDTANITQIHLNINGTQNAIFSAVAGGMSSGQATQQAVDLNFAEPAAPGKSANIYEVLRAEAVSDVTRKLGLFHNYLGLSVELLDWRDLEVNLTREQISDAMRLATDRRYIVSLYPKSYAEEHGGYPEADVIGLWTHDHQNWHIVGGYQDTRSSPLSRFAGMSGPDNGVIVGVGPSETDGIYGGPLGPGAGLRPTVNAMLDEDCLLEGLFRNGDV